MKSGEPSRRSFVRYVLHRLPMAWDNQAGDGVSAQRRVVRRDDFAAQGHSETGTSLKLAMPNGMPMIVTHSASPVTMWAEGQPPARQDQPRTLPMHEGAPGVTALDRRVPEGPQGVDADAEGGDAERDADDRDAEEQSAAMSPRNSQMPLGMSQ